MGRGPAKRSPPNKKPGTRKAPPGRRAAPRRTAKTAKPRRSRSAKPRSEAARLAGELKEALQRQAATADILKVIASSPADVQPVFESIVVTAARLLRCDIAFIMRCDGAIYRSVAAATIDGLRPVLNAEPRPVDPAADFPSRVIASRQSLYLPDWSRIELPAFERMVRERRGLNSALFLPMLHEEHCIGVLSLASKQIDNFDLRDIALAESFRDQALIAIENARLFNETKEALEQQTATSEVLEVISSSPGDLQPVFAKMLENAVRACAANFGIMNLWDGEKFEIVADHNVPPDFAAYRQGTVLYPHPDTRLAEVVRTHRSVQVADLRESPAYLAGVPMVVRMVDVAGARTLMVVPMLKEDELVGAITIFRREVRLFTDKQIALVENFTKQAVIAIENTRLLRELRERTDDLSESLAHQTATSEVLQAIGSSMADTQPVFERILDSVERLFEVRQCSVILARDGMLHRVARRGVRIEAVDRLYPAPIAQTTTGEVIATRRQIYISSAANSGSPQMRQVADGMGDFALVITPMVWEGRGIGVINVAREPYATFSEKELALLRTFADQAVIAIQNARLFNETREALERQTATADILKVIASSPDNVQPVFEAIAERAKKLVGAHATTVLRIVGDMVDVAAFTPISEEADAVLRASFPLPIVGNPDFEKLRRGETAETIDRESESVHPEFKKIARARGFRSRLLVPLKSDGGVIGAISVTRVEPGAFAEHHVQLLHTFADQAVIAIQNVQLFNETKEALERQTATADILKVIASSPDDVQPVFDAIAERANKLIGGHATAVVRVAGDMAELAAFTPVSEEADAVLRAAFPMPIAGNPLLELIKHGGISEISDTESEMYADLPIRQVARARGFRSRLLVPLKTDSGVIGAINVTRVEPGAFAEHHVQLLQTFADQAVIAIQNVRLFNETKEALQRQTATADILKVIASSPSDVQPVFEAIAEQSNRLLNGLATAVYSVAGDAVHLMSFTPVSPAADAYLKTMFPFPAADAVWVRSARNGETFSVVDIEDESVSQRIRDIGRRRGWRSVLYAPLLNEGRLIGAISVTRREAGAFADDHVQLLRTFADQAVIAIENVRLFEEVQARTKELAASLEDLRAAQDRLIQTEKLASLGQLTAGIAHEIKNPLNFVNNFSALSAELTDELNDLLARAALTDKMQEEVGELTKLLKENLEKVVQHGKRADSIVKNMLLHSREGSGELRPADINALVDESLNLAYHGARAEKSGFNITLERDFDAGAGTAELFPQEITRALLNLISNGFYAATRHHTENGEPGFEPTLLATTRNLGDAVEIRIRDNGTGIPPEVKEKMFNPFFTTKPAGEGTGLGLSMTHDIIVKQHGGRINVATEPGQFTEFIIVLPRTSSSQKAR